MRLTVCGSFGFGNVGDEAIPLAIYDMAEKHDIPVELDILSRFDRPEMTSVVGLGEHDSERRELLKGQPIIMCGGGIIEPRNVSTLLRCQKYLQPKFTPHASLMAVSVDAGIKYGIRNNWRIRYAVRNIEKIYVRDILSEQVLRQLLPGKSVETIGDLVLWLSPSTLDFAYDQILNDRYIAVSLAGNWNNEPSWYSWICGELSRLSRLYEADIVFIPMSCDESDDDREEHRRIKNHMLHVAPDVNTILIETPLMPKTVSTYFSRAFLVVAMRLHGCVMAYAQKTPFVGISYHPKIHGFVDTVGWRKAIVPMKRPKYQSDSLYGYKFDDLNIEKSMLVSAANYAISNGNFSSLEKYKSRIAEVFLEFIHKAYS